MAQCQKNRSLTSFILPLPMPAFTSAVLAHKRYLRLYCFANRRIISRIIKKICALLEQRMIQSGHLKKAERLTPKNLSAIAETVIERLDVGQARREAEPFVKDPETLIIWSQDFFRDVIRRIVFV
jgi:hypothetical protein